MASSPKDPPPDEPVKDPEPPSESVQADTTPKDPELPSDTVAQDPTALDAGKKRGRPRTHPADENRVKRPRGRPKKSSEQPMSVGDADESTYTPPPPPPLYASLSTSHNTTTGTYYDSANLAAAAAAATAAADAAATNGSHDPPNPGPQSSNETFLTHARNHTDFLLHNSPIYKHLLSNVQVVSASPASVTTRLKLETHHLNSKGSLHGSVTATFVDFIGGLAIACFDRRANTGVSTDLHVSYLGKATAGQTIDIEGIAEKVGGTLAFTRVAVRTVATGGKRGDLVAMGRHTKFVKTKAAVS